MICRIRNKRKLKSQESNYDGMIEYGHGTMGIDDIWIKYGYGYDMGLIYGWVWVHVYDMGLIYGMSVGMGMGIM